MLDKVNISYFESKLTLKTVKHTNTPLLHTNILDNNIHKYNDLIFRNFVLDCKEFDSYNVHFYINVGSSNEVKGKYGISHVLEHMIFKKTAKFNNAIELASYLEEYNITFNAYTTFNKTCYMYSTNNTKSKNLNKIFFVAYQMLFEMQINNSDLETEKNIILQEYYQGIDNKSEFIEELFNIIYYANHPHHIPTIGYINDIKHMISSDITDFYKQHYTPQNINCFIFGNSPNVNTCSLAFNKYIMTPLYNSVTTHSKFKYNLDKTDKTKKSNKTNNHNKTTKSNKTDKTKKTTSVYTISSRIVKDKKDILNELKTVSNIASSFPDYYPKDIFTILDTITTDSKSIIKHIIDKNISNYLNNNNFKIIYKKHNKHNYIITAHVNNMNQAYIYLVLPNYGYTDKNINYIKLFTNILGNKKLFTNILFNILREKHGVSYDITVSNTFLKNCGYTYILIKVNHSDLNKSVKILQDIILQLINDCKNKKESVNNLITIEKFNKIKDFLINDINTIYDNVDNIESFYVDKMIYQYDLFNINDYKRYINNVDYNKFKNIIYDYLKKYIIYIFI